MVAVIVSGRQPEDGQRAPGREVARCGSIAQKARDGEILALDPEARCLVHSGEYGQPTVCRRGDDGWVGVFCNGACIPPEPASEEGIEVPVGGEIWLQKLVERNGIRGNEALDVGQDCCWIALIVVGLALADT